MARFAVGLSPSPKQCGNGLQGATQSAEKTSPVPVRVVLVRLLASLLFLAGVAVPSLGQFDQAAGPTDWSTSNIHLSIPVRSKPDAGFNYSIEFNSHMYVGSSPTNHLPVWVSAPTIVGMTGYEWGIGYQYVSTATGCTTYGDANVVLPDGESHPLPAAFTWRYSADGKCESNTLPPTSTTTDGSGITVVIPTGSYEAWTAYDRAGNNYTLDAFGNSINASFTFTDTNGQTVTGPAGIDAAVPVYVDKFGIANDNSDGDGGVSGGAGAVYAIHNRGSNGTSDIYEYVNEQGTLEQFVVSYAGPYTLATDFGCSNIADETAFSPTFYLPVEVLRPDNLKYTFTWEPDPADNTKYTGRIASITYPTGGVVSYQYKQGTNTNGKNGIDCTSAVTPEILVTTADTYGDTATATYTVVNNWTGTTTPTSNFTVTTTNNVNSRKAVDSYSGQSDPNLTGGFLPTWPFTGLFHTGTVVTDTSLGTTMSTSITCYNQYSLSNPANCVAPTGTNVPAYPITQKDAFSNLGSMGMTTNHVSQTFSQTYGLPLITISYDWGKWGGGGLSQHRLTYGNWNGTACVAFAHNTYIRNRICLDQVTDAGYTTNYRYEYRSYNDTATQGGDLLDTYQALTTTPTYFTTTYTVNAEGAPLTSVNPGGPTTITEGDCGGFLPTKISFPVSAAGNVQKTWDCAQDVLASVTDQNGNATRFTYSDPLSRITRLLYPDATSDQDTFSYNINNSLPIYNQQTTALGVGTGIITNTELNGFGRVVQTQTVDPNAGSATYRTVASTYNGLGQLFTKTNPYYTTGDPTYGLFTFYYDALGRNTQTTRPDGNNAYHIYENQDSETYISTSSGLLNSSQTIYEVDGMGRTLKLCTALNAGTQANQDTPVSCGFAEYTGPGFVTALAYDPASQLVTATYGGTTYHESKYFYYDLAGRVYKKTLPESGTDTYAFDTTLVGAPYAHTDARSITTTYSFDGLYRLTGLTFSDATPSVAYAYDVSSCGGANVVGRLTTAATSNTWNAFGYDTMGRLAGQCEVTPLSYGVAAADINWAYDFAGNLTAIADAQANNTLTYGRNSIGQVTSITPSYTGSNGDVVPSGITNDYKYNALGEVTQVADPNNFVQTYAYDKMGRLTSNSYPLIGSPAITYNAVNDVTSVIDVVNGSWTYTYDPAFAHRLIGASCTNCPNNWGTEAYTYDEFDNKWTESSTVGPNTSYTFNVNNQIQSASATYDAAGNMTADTVGDTFTFDALNRMTGENAGGGIYTYIYDPFGNQAEKTGPVYGTKDYIYNGRQYLHMNSATIVGQNMNTGLGQYNGSPGLGTELYYIDYRDQVGTNRAQNQYTPTGGVTGSSYTNLPFGEAFTAVNGANPDNKASNRFYFGDIFNNSGTDNHADNRDYNPLQGRWFSIDPAHSGWNAYTYASNSPVSFNDPSGLDDDGGGGGGDVDDVGAGNGDGAAGDKLAPQDAAQGQAQDLKIIPCATQDCSMTYSADPPWWLTPGSATYRNGQSGGLQAGVPRWPQNQITISSITNSITEHQGGSRTSVTTTTTATFSTASNNAGQFLGATTETVTSQIPANILQLIKDTTTGPHAIGFAQATQAMGANKMAAGVEAALPSFATQFAAVTLKDASAHPGKYVFAAGEIGLIFTPLPEAFAAIEGMHEVKAAIDTGLAAGDLTYEVLGP
jgi:RHS repeat-associated protein